MQWHIWLGLGILIGFFLSDLIIYKILIKRIIRKNKTNKEWEEDFKKFTIDTLSKIRLSEFDVESIKKNQHVYFDSEKEAFVIKDIRIKNGDKR
jgi:hypothetical protein